ncbi:unnamed protein product [Phytomonas sp. Hart1]|nr:unnamed protein product [Phytomonas sp. Hart1]|eukprot:CCW69263.1 unnamed protein product [Phytomonas sp. isolate Hart1]
MQDFLNAINEYRISIKSSKHAKPSPHQAARQLVGSLVLKNRVNLLCASVIASFMCSKDMLVVISKDTVQCINCDGDEIRHESSISNSSLCELSAIVATPSGAIVASENGICRVSLPSLLIEKKSSDFLTRDPQYRILCVSSTPDGSYFATGGGNAVVTVWTYEMNPMHFLLGHTDWVRFVKFARGSNPTLQLFSAGDDGVIYQWDPLAGSVISRLDYTKGQSIQVFEMNFNSGLMAVACNAPFLALYRCRSDNRTRRSGDNILLLRELGVITGAHETTPTAAKFTEDSQWIVSAGEDEVLAISSVAEPRQIFICRELVSKRYCTTFLGTFNCISILSAPPDSSVFVVVVCASNGTVVQWVVDPRRSRTTYIKKIQLHLGVLISMDFIHKRIAV